MKLDEFAFVNQQLAGMLRAGTPLEGALRRTCETLHDGTLRVELSGLEADLARGTPLRQAVAARQLPGFYARMLELGTRGSDLPALLTLLADYYQRLHLTWVRLKGLIFYPAVVLVVSLGVSVLVAVIFSHFSQELRGTVSDATGGVGAPASAWFFVQAGLWMPATLIGLLAGIATLIAVVPRWRERALWRIPGFREARLSNLASSLSLLLQHGSSPRDAVAFVKELEDRSPASAEVGQWQQRMADGQTRFEDIAAGGRVVPPLFIWLVAASGENWVEGFRHAADVYYERGVQRAELMLYAVLPISVIALGCLIVLQLLPMARVFEGFTRTLLDFNADL